MLLPVIVLVLGVLARFIPHVWNFTPVLVVVLFGGYTFLFNKIAKPRLAPVLTGRE